jgi:hypothetical protein
VRDAALEPESDLRAGPIERRPGAVARALPGGVVADGLIRHAADHIDRLERAGWRQTRERAPHRLDLRGISRTDRRKSVRKGHLGPRC